MSEERVVYDTSCFHVPDGWYTLDELRAMVAAAEEVKRNADAALAKSMEKI